MTQARSLDQLWETYRQAHIRAQETLAFSDAEIARRAYRDFVTATDRDATPRNLGANVIDLEARRERKS